MRIITSLIIGTIFLQANAANNQPRQQSIAQPHGGGQSFNHTGAMNNFAGQPHNGGETFNRNQTVNNYHEGYGRGYRNDEININAPGVRLNAEGERYHYGYGVPVNYERARNHYAEAVEFGSPVAAHHLGDFYFNGWGVPIDLIEADRWYNTSIQLDPSLENVCINGQCSDRLLSYLVRRAANGDPEAQFELAQIYEFGIPGVEIDLVKARRYYGRAAALNYAPAIEWHRRYFR